MKLYSFAVLVTIMIGGCNSSEKKVAIPETTAVKVTSFDKMEALNWILGRWNNISVETQSYEAWEKENDSLYIGMSVTMRSGDTVFAERMRLFQNKGIVGLYVETIGEEPNPVLFTQVPNAEHLFTFENAENGFPSQIIYTQPEDDKLHAWVSGTIEGAPQKVDFYFSKEK